MNAKCSNPKLVAMAVLCTRQAAKQNVTSVRVAAGLRACRLSIEKHGGQGRPPLRDAPEMTFSDIREEDWEGSVENVTP